MGALGVVGPLRTVIPFVLNVAPTSIGADGFVSSATNVQVPTSSG